MTLTPKQEKFCQCVVSGMSYKDSYMTAYNCNSNNAAYVESSKLALREDIQDRINALLKPIEKTVTSQVISEREKKRQWLWNMIENAQNDNDKLRAMDILNRMDSEYLNINVNKTDSQEDMKILDIETLRQLTG